MEAPTTVEEIFNDYRGRREALVKALTTDESIFSDECDPNKDNLCLYGLPDGEWKVSLPVEEVPPELPEPALGINFARDGMKKSDWLALVAVHSDAWLYSVAFYHAARLHKADRKRLFDLMNTLPTLTEVLHSKPAKKPNSNSTKTKKPPAKIPRRKKEDEEGDEEEGPEEEEDEDEDEEDEEEEAYCGICAAPYTQSQFWIACDSCQKWYHGSCVKMNANKASSIKNYHCPSCVKKKPRH